MTEEQIQQAFEGRWRIKSECLECMEMYTHVNVRGVIQSKLDHIKDFCHDFFRAGIMLAEGGREATYSEVCDFNAPFEKFWNLYDKKVGRPKCEKLWSKLTMAERVACLNYIPLYKQAQPEKCYRKNPETFLRNKSWNDELIFKNNGTNQPTIDEQRRDKLASILTD